uniref:F-box only protein 41-like n=1 Tax=Phallusia mammillata TaxID=59560 RepID=A0A6F9DC24_9ASCI|nr:F-box only protein 41-like [Phallusia mammillata]
MSDSNGLNGMYYEATDLLPYRCPSCGSGKRFRSLVALRMHMSVIHTEPSQNNLSGSGDAGARQEKDKWEEMLTSGKSVDSMLDKYSAKMDTILNKYDRESQELENKVRIAKQLEEIRQQKKELKKMSVSWKATHDMSQLIQDTDHLIQRRVGDGEQHNPVESKTYAALGNEKNGETELQRQVELSIELAAKYKSMALEAENKLKEKEIEEKHMKQYITHVAKKEKVARQQLAGFMEEILERAEYAEEELESYKSPSTIGGSGSNRSSLMDRRKSFEGSPGYTPKSSIKQNRSRSMTVGDIPSTTNGRTNAMKRNGSHQKRDPYVEEMLEAPSSQELPRRAEKMKRHSQKRQLSGVDTSNLFDGSNMRPFSNVQNKSSPYGAEHREVVLFYVFAHLPSLDLLRCSSVCHEWRGLSHDPQLWSRISFENVYLNPKLLHSISHWATETCLIKLRNIDAIHDKQASLGSFEEGLESVLKSSGENLLLISIENCDPVVTSRTMWLLTCYNKNVRSVTYRSSLDPLSYQVAWAMGTACRNIESLEVAPVHPCLSSDLFNNNVARLMSWCWPGLRALSIGGPGIDGSGLLAVALNCHHLKVLELDHAKGVTEDTAQSACKHGLKDLRILLFTHTPVLASTVVVFLKNSPLKLLQVSLEQQDFFPKKGKQAKIIPEYNKLQASFQKLQRRPEFQRVLQISC